ncbi:DUF2834 domain-containing protein [Pleurocapsales cyanobacterium LEGE 10410]|nr:DUF2834 domain-containing protein [Pleurocapsales cyanobacterium LEGE 10410]
MMQLTYLFLSIIGLVLPCWQLISFIYLNGLDFPLFWSQLFINQISSAFGLDLFVSSVVFWFFLFREGTRLQMKLLWIYVVLSLTVGLSFALPLFLGMRLASNSLSVSVSKA